MDSLPLNSNPVNPLSGANETEEEYRQFLIGERKRSASDESRERLEEWLNRPPYNPEPTQDERAPLKSLFHWKTQEEIEARRQRGNESKNEERNEKEEEKEEKSTKHHEEVVERSETMENENKEEEKEQKQTSEVEPETLPYRSVEGETVMVEQSEAAHSLPSILPPQFYSFTSFHFGSIPFSSGISLNTREMSMTKTREEVLELMDMVDAMDCSGSARLPGPAQDRFRAQYFVYELVWSTHFPSWPLSRMKFSQWRGLVIQTLGVGMEGGDLLSVFFAFLDAPHPYGIRHPLAAMEASIRDSLGLDQRTQAKRPHRMAQLRLQDRTEDAG